MFLDKLYYSIWTDGIKRMQERFPESNFYWKFMLMLAMVFSFGLFSMFFYIFIGRIIGLSMPRLNILNSFWANLISPIVFFYLPWFFIHYYFVFWQNKYMIFLPKYKYRNGKLFFNFFLCVIFIPLFLLIFGVIIAKIMAN